MKTLTVFLCLLFGLMGCTSTNGGLDPLKEHIQKANYTMSTAPNSNLGATTIMRRQGDQDIVVALPGEVVPLSLVAKGTVVLPNYSSSILLDIKAGASFVKVPLKLEGEYKKTQKLSITLGPFENEIISEISLLRWIKANPDAYELVKDRYIIIDAIKSTYVDYQFLDAGEASLKLQADHLPKVIGEVGVSGQWQVINETTLRYNGPLYLGRKIIKINKKTLSNSTESSYSIEAVAPIP